jgi:hypothetical protein
VLVTDQSNWESATRNCHSQVGPHRSGPNANVMTTLDIGVSEWLTGVMGLVITDWETDFRDGYKFGQILLKLEVLDDDDDEDEYRFEPVGLWIRRSSKEIVVDDNYGYVRTALEDINIELTENGVQLLKVGTLKRALQVAE